MPSAFQDNYGWIARFRGLNKKRRTVRIPPEYIAIDPNPKRAADEYARDCERACRLIEIDPSEPRIEHARSIKAITKDQAEALAGKAPMPPADKFTPLTIEAAAEMHPSTKREPPDQYLRHQKYLEQFIEFSGIKNLADLQLDHIQKWLDHLKTDRNYKYDTRRHALLFIRRALQMGISRGIPNFIAGLTLDRRDSPPDIETIPLKDICEKIIALKRKPRFQAFLALGGFMGLRPSEMARIKIGDIQNGTLRIGTRTAKNDPSRRELPIPRIVKLFLKPLINENPEAPLLEIRSRNAKKIETAERHFNSVGLYHWAQFENIKPKILRKSFATWVTHAGIQQWHLDLWLGHRSGYIPAIRARHYTAALQARELKPVAKLIDKTTLPILRNCLRDAEKTDLTENNEA